MCRMMTEELCFEEPVSIRSWSNCVFRERAQERVVEEFESEIGDELPVGVDCSLRECAFFRKRSNNPLRSWFARKRVRSVELSEPLPVNQARVIAGVVEEVFRDRGYEVSVEV